MDSNTPQEPKVIWCIWAKTWLIFDDVFSKHVFFKKKKKIEKVSKPVNCKYYFKGSHTKDEVKDLLLEGAQSYTQYPFFSFTSLSLTLLNTPKMNTHRMDKAVEFVNI